MLLTSSNNTITCETGNVDYYRSVGLELSFLCYTVLTPFYFLIGVFSRTICFIAFYRQYKHEKAYGYQIYVALSDTLEVITKSIDNVTNHNLAGFQLPGALWFQQNYFLMWYSAHLASPLAGVFITTSLFINTSMACDRLFVLWSPFAHQKIDHFRHQLIAITTCFLIGLSTSIFECFSYNVISDGYKYIMVVNEDFSQSETAFALQLLRNVIRMIGNVAIIGCNIAVVLLYYFRTHQNEILQGRLEHRIRVKSVQRTLFFLTISQSFFTTIDITMYTIYNSLFYTLDDFSDCIGKILGPATALTLQIACILEFGAIMIISRSFRNTILSCLTCKNRK